eukprot:TRINITY_DN3485_c0_g1_i1.p1 TRINITY_DN3485_c0_g1~~TRINITY_DN3485_c0_g1_i1.p1  ORF type:complete len:639 (+),score=91.79 TRINITY_DN3485_c0_g1_i1:79-1917(+)
MEFIIEEARKCKIYKGITVDENVITTKDIVQKGLGKGDEGLSGDSSGVVWCGSGGMATAKRFYTPVDSTEWGQEEETAKTFCKEIDFFTKGMAVVNLLAPQSGGYPLYETIQRLATSCGASILPCDSRQSDDYITRTMQRFKANTILSTTNRLAQLVWFMQTEGIKNIPITNIILYGNLPHTAQYRSFQQQFAFEQHSKVFNPSFSAIYGTAELGIIGFSPHQLRDLQMFLTCPHVQLSLKKCSRSELPPSTMESFAEVYENQRKYPMVGWKSKLMKKDPPQWTDENLNPQRRSEVKLPSVEEHGVWGFSGKWEIANDWSCAWDWSGPWLPEDELITMGSPHGKREKPKIRRRKWKVKMVRIESPEERGSGRVLCTMMHRKRIPILRYDTGDVAKTKIIQFAGERRAAVRLTARQHLTFSLGENLIFLSELEPLLGEYLDFQVIHDYREDEGGSKDVVIINLLLTGKKGQKEPRQMDIETKKRLAMSVRDVIRSPRGDQNIPEYHVEVHSIKPSVMKTCETSGKLRRLIDARGTGGVPLIVPEGADTGSSLELNAPSPLSNLKLTSKPSMGSNYEPSVAPSMAPSFAMHSAGGSSDQRGVEEEDGMSISGTS